MFNLVDVVAATDLCGILVLILNLLCNLYTSFGICYSRSIEI